MVDENLIPWQVLQQTDNGTFKLVVIDHDTHALATQYVAGSYKYRVSYFVRNLNCFVNSVSCSVFRIRNIQILQHITETATVFSDIHIIIRSSDDRNSFLVQFLC